MTTAETAWAEAMKFENRHDPYEFFDRLRETPVVQVADRTYVVTGYRELMTLAHDPRISSDITRSPLRDVKVPVPGPGEVLVKVGGAGACHSDLHLLELPAGSRPFALTFTLGHENAGWVETMGPGATGFSLGDPVIVYGPWGCGLCMNCREGMENYCQTALSDSPGRTGPSRGRPAE